MKQIFKIFFLLLVINGHTQEKQVKNSEKILRQNQTSDVTILELKAPLNLLPCKNCIAENPTIDLSQLNEDKEFIKLFSDVINNELVVFDFLIDKFGNIVEVRFNKNFNSNFYDIKNLEIINTLLDKWKNKKLFSFSIEPAKVKTSLSFVLKESKLILNPITHR